MTPVSKDIIVPKEILSMFQNSVRIIDKRKLKGMWPVEAVLLKKLQNTLPELLGANILKKYDLAIAYKGNSMKNDFAKIGIDLIDSRIVNNILIRGIPVPWTMIRKAGIDHQKFDFILTPKM